MQKLSKRGYTTVMTEESDVDSAFSDSLDEQQLCSEFNSDAEHTADIHLPEHRRGRPEDRVAEGAEEDFLEKDGVHLQSFQRSGPKPGSMLKFMGLMFALLMLVVAGVVCGILFCGCRPDDDEKNASSTTTTTTTTTAGPNSRSTTPVRIPATAVQKTKRQWQKANKEGANNKKPVVQPVTFSTPTGPVLPPNGGKTTEKDGLDTLDIPGGARTLPADLTALTAFDRYLERLRRSGFDSDVINEIQDAGNEEAHDSDIMYFQGAQNFMEDDDDDDAYYSAEDIDDDDHEEPAYYNTSNEMMNASKYYR